MTQELNDNNRLTKEDVELAKAAFKAFSQAFERTHLYTQSVKIKRANQLVRDNNQAEYDKLDAEISRELDERQELDNSIYQLIYKIERIFIAQNPGKADFI